MNDNTATRNIRVAVTPSKVAPFDIRPARIRELAGGFNYALEATGSPEVLQQGIDNHCYPGKDRNHRRSAPGMDAGFDTSDPLIGGKHIRGIVAGDSVSKIFITQLVYLYLKGNFLFYKLLASMISTTLILPSR
ncbi:hypothetical protein ACUN9V_16095 [Salinicola sp. V024]|uniref:hypothetical protein n=1 Tax=Salinicola sp. V024 TaxID=3459609 RepID=UPI004044A499